MFACQNVTLLNQVPNATSFHYPLRIIAEQNINIVLDGCKVNGLVPTKGFAMKSSEFRYKSCSIGCSFIFVDPDELQEY